jgi:F0F1-type ATP synthase delta subunit
MATKIVVHSAIKLDERSKTTLTKFIKSKHSVTPSLAVVVDPGLIAGFRFMVEGVEYDYSISGSLSRLQQEL